MCKWRLQIRIIFRYGSTSSTWFATYYFATLSNLSQLLSTPSTLSTKNWPPAQCFSFLYPFFIISRHYRPGFSHWPGPFLSSDSDTSLWSFSSRKLHLSIAIHTNILTFVRVVAARRQMETDRPRKISKHEVWRNATSIGHPGNIRRKSNTGKVVSGRWKR